MNRRETRVALFSGNTVTHIMVVYDNMASYLYISRIIA